jgi:hypothetical protein
MILSQPEVFMAVLQGAEMLQAELPMFKFLLWVGRRGCQVVKRVVVARQERLRSQSWGMKLLSDQSQPQVREIALPLFGGFAGDW